MTFTQDKSKDIRIMLHELQNSVITAVLLVVVIMLMVLGGRASLFIGIAIPASFLAGILGLQLAGLTVNIVVLFSLILAVGMLVDDAIIVSEFAERRMAEGMAAARRLFARGEAHGRPGDRRDGDARRRLLAAPLLAGHRRRVHEIHAADADRDALGLARRWRCSSRRRSAPCSAAPATAKRRATTCKDRGLYMRTVKLALRHPLGDARRWPSLLLVGVIQAYGTFGNGVEFFPDIEPDFGLVQVRARGNLSIQEKDQLVRQVEERLLGMQEIETVYARAGEGQRGSQEVTEDTVGTVQFEFVDWKERRKASVIIDEIRDKTKDIPGVIIEVTKPQGGPPTGKPITLQIASIDPELLFPAARKAADIVRANPDTRDVDDGLPLPGIDWKLDVDKAEAAKYGASPVTVGTAVQLVTNGVKVSEYRPGDDRQVGRHPGALPAGAAQPRRSSTS